MDIDPKQLDMPRAYKLLTGLVVPRPIAWISTLDEQGQRNLAPFSFFNGVSVIPMTLSVSFYNTRSGDGRKDTLRNILATEEFVVHVVHARLAEAMNVSATDFPPDVDEFEQAGLTPAPSAVVRPPRIAEAGVALECRLMHNLAIGEGFGGSTLVIGEVVHVHVDDALINERLHIDLAGLDAIGRLAGPSYSTIRDQLSLERPTYAKPES